MRECDCVPGHVCDCWAYRGDPALAADWDKAVEDIHRAFCYPEHEKVGVWDKSMADALRRRGYVIVRRGLLERVCRDGEYEQMEAIGQLMGILGLSYDPAQDRMVGWQTVDDE